MMITDKCQWVKAWIGTCNKPCTPGEFCEEHSGRSCAGCGRGATRECDQTIGAFVCGSDLCDECHHTDPMRMAHAPKKGNPKPMTRLMAHLDEIERLNKVRAPWCREWSLMLDWIQAQIVEGLGDPNRYTLQRRLADPGFPVLELTLAFIPGRFRFAAVEAAKDEEGGEGGAFIFYGDTAVHLYEEEGKWRISEKEGLPDTELTGDTLADALMWQINKMQEPT